ncbi:MAG: hypothetical protein A3C74_01695 [Candidatus Magasanikbacteria bacterium RIFCSPHIGHO2_02_FULL_44_13]|nr:MAG: hypothetical protein A3C74_01695 [Candidatus Magasanikbacteria bacterium RIFCSPHIGHO2_02_FULL_44_13]
MLGAGGNKMQFTRRHAFGIVIGVAATIVAANGLNMFLNWETAAIVCGLLLGLEAGFWSGFPGLTYEVHARIFNRLLTKEFWSGLGEVFGVVIFYATAIVGIVLSAYTGVVASKWLYNQQWLLQLMNEDAGISTRGTEPSCLILAILLAYVAVMGLSNVLNHHSHKRLKCCLLHIPISLAIGLLVPVALPVLIVALVLVAGAGVIISAGMIVYCLLTVAARQEAATITVGVIVGGISGLCYGRWTQLAFGPTTLSIMVGAAAGLASAYAAYRLGRLLPTADKPATETAS